MASTSINLLFRKEGGSETNPAPKTAVSKNIARFAHDNDGSKCHFFNLESPYINTKTIPNFGEPNQRTLAFHSNSPNSTKLEFVACPIVHGITVNERLPQIHGGKLGQLDPNNVSTYRDPIELLVQTPLDISGDNSLHKPLWDAQVSGVEFLITRKQALLADDPGLGKTVQAIVALKLLFRLGLIRTALIVCPKSTIGDRNAAIETGDARQWEGHLELWAPELHVKTILPAVWEGGIPPKGFSGSASLDRKRDWLEPAHVYLTTYSLARNDIKNNILSPDHFGAVILDEAHNIKNPNSQQSIALRALNAEYRWGLTGTPVQNNASELYAICQFLKPGEFGPLRPKQMLALDESYITTRAAPFVIRREKKEEDLPPKNHHDHWVDLTTEQAAEYSEIYVNRRQRLIQLTNEGRPERETKTSILGAIQKLKQTCNFDGIEYSSNKISILNEILTDAQSSQRKVLVFSQYLGRGIDPISDRITAFAPIAITGGVPHAERQERIEKFKSDPDTNVLLLSLRAASEGLNLQEASIVVHFDHWWNPAVQWQAEGRAHRHGQMQTVDVHSLRVKDTIDEKIYKMLESKSEIIRRMMADFSAGRAELEINRSFDLDDLLSLFEL